MTDYETILVEVDDGVATVTLNRPDRLNAWTATMGWELRHALSTLDVDDDVRAIVVTGAGRAFCAGADLEAGGDTFTGGGPRQAPEHLRPPTDRDYWEMPTPIIAAINGHAVGVGLTMPMQWDIRVVAEDAKLGFVFNRRGILPELASHWIVPRVVGLARGVDLLVTGRIFSGREAAAMGLAVEALPAVDVLERAREIARDIAENVAPVSAAISKRLVYAFAQMGDMSEAHRIESRLFAWVTSQPDAREGPVAFLEKRRPDWKLRKSTDLPTDLLPGG